MTYGPGTVIADKLRLVRPLARGGMGSVWVADHLGLQARVAVKFVSESFGDDSSVLTRFAREAAAAAKMRSPHVVQILDYGSIDGRIPYIVMELLEGESLGDRVTRLGRIPVAEAVSIVQQTCKALARAHSLGIIHRDIKPDNVFLTDADGDLFVKVLDFGIAKVEAPGSVELTSTGTTVGTPNFASPEQLLSAKSATVSMDLWAVAATAYRAITGELPFTAETFAGLCLAITRGVFPAPTELQPDLPIALNAFFARALDVTPERRFGSARELAEQFAIAAGVSRTSINVPLAVAHGTPGSWDRPPSDAGHATHTVGVPQLETPGRAGSSIGGAALTNERDLTRGRPSSAIIAVVAAAVVGLGIAVAVLLTRGTPETAPAATGGTPPRATETAPTNTGTPPEPTAAPAEPRVVPSEPPVASAPLPVPVETAPPIAAAPQSPAPASTRPRKPAGAGGVSGPRRKDGTTAAPPSQGNDYGF